MNDVNLMEAFASYKVKAARLARSAMTPDGDLVISCLYGGFKKAEVGTLSYEEDLSGQTGKMAMALRGHLVEALSSECGIRVIVAVGTRSPKADAAPVAPARTTYYARKDLVGRVSAFDGERFVVNFKRAQTPAQGKSSKRRAAHAAQFDSADS
jgi:hypothetical protein